MVLIASVAGMFVILVVLVGCLIEAQEDRDTECEREHGWWDIDD
jgi:hypothetical protein